jgi:hypothetical protein
MAGISYSCQTHIRKADFGHQAGSAFFVLGIRGVVFSGSVSSLVTSSLNSRKTEAVFRIIFVLELDIDVIICFYAFMRTTIDIPDQLMKKAKIKAVREGITLKKLLVNSLEKELADTNEGRQDAPWKSLRGQGSADSLSAEESGFDDYSGPGYFHANQVNEPE